MKNISNLKDAEIVSFKTVEDKRGNLIEVNFDRDLHFPVERIFFVYDVPSTDIRGKHAHLKCHQLLVCISGSVLVLADDGSQKKEFHLSKPYQGLYLPPMIWAEQYKYSNDAVLMVYASHAYDEGDYIRNYDEYLARIKHERK